MVNVKLTEKEEKAIATVNAFMQGLKDCKKEDEEKYLIDNAFASRMILSFGKSEPKDTYAILSASIIHMLIPYLMSTKKESIDDVAEQIDNKTDEMLKSVVSEIAEKNSEETESDSE